MPLTWGCSHWHKYDDEIIRSHARSANEGKRGRFAGTRGERRIENAEYYPHADDRASTRDWNKTAREGEKAIEKPYDATTGTPKSWSNPVDAEPDRAKFEDGHLIDDAEVAPPKPKKGEVEAL
jgi:hypothetical protein